MPVVPGKSSGSLVLGTTGPHLRPCPPPPPTCLRCLIRSFRSPRDASPCSPAGSAAPGSSRALLRLVERTGADTEVTVIANTADDIWVHGLKVCPDLDTVMYTLGDGIDQERGWGRTAETWNAKDELAAYGVEPTWFGLGDRDIATHLVRTQMLDAGYPLSAVTAALCKRWEPGCRAAADDRRPGRDPRGHRRPRDRRAAGGALPGVLDPPPGLRAGARGGADRDRGRQARSGRPRGARRRRRRPHPAVQPGGLRGHDPRGAGHP